MSATLKSKAIQGVFWSLLDRVGQQGISFLITILLARFLMPEQFGLVAMLLVFLEMARTFVDSGFANALIQRKQATDLDACSIFYFNIVVGFLGAGLLCAVSPLVAGFYHEPILAPLLCALSITLVIESFGAIQGVLLTKHIDFKTQVKVNLTAIVPSGALGIAMAISGFGVWSLVAQSIGRSLVGTVFLWLLSPWRPRLIFSLAALREMFGFGSRLFASSLLDTIFENIYPVAIGRMFSAAQLGLYSGARRIERMATYNLSLVVTRVTFPLFATIQDDIILLKRSLRKTVSLLALIHLPLMVGLIVTAKPLVYVLLTEKWAPAIGWLQLLCVANLTYPLHGLYLNTLKSLGRSDLFFWLAVLQKALIAALIVVTYRWGVTGLIWGQIALLPLGYYIVSYYMVRLLHYSLKEQWADVAPYAAVSLFMGFAVYALQFVPVPSEAVRLLAAVSLGVGLYAVLSYALGLSAFAEVLRAAKDKLRPHWLFFVGD
jgi:teichuronic acid exporter